MRIGGARCPAALASYAWNSTLHYKYSRLLTEPERYPCKATAAGSSVIAIDDRQSRHARVPSPPPPTQLSNVALLLVGAKGARGERPNPNEIALSFLRPSMSQSYLRSFIPNSPRLPSSSRASRVYVQRGRQQIDISRHLSFYNQALWSTPFCHF
ncbi:hypothetical protein IE81DRAFT_28462 [Ceraceosorus guamensis]|uniref:Uncharacterized protein n=1 Tax=Ceraceosorus guamensis TaxID=1522189 RepID=A0A316W967_9BASI|nr:hypothetical protein IE81DRAFT_28462 [Ceraceosorus guamensis]PWN44265.1 hypothetical protein IE81DRAFT_28462 [Ceraceosorus guamensis]